MADFGDYPPNMAPQDALVVRSQKEADHAVVPYSAEDLARPHVGPANPFSRVGETNGVGGQKRKNVLSGTAEETFVSEHAFRSKHRAVEGRGGPEREMLSGAEIKAQNAAIRAGRESKGNAMIADGDGAYVGPWAQRKAVAVHEHDENEDREEGAELASDEEYEEVVVYEDDEGDVVESGTVLSAPAPALARRKEVETQGSESSAFLGSQQYDYLGRTYMHVPQDLDVDLRKEVGSITNYIPRKLLYTWKAPGAGVAVTALELFPDAGHLLLSGSADNTVRLWDMYHQRELLRTFDGHTRAITDVSFNLDGTRFVTGSHDRWMKVWDTETGACVNRFRTGKTPHCLAFNRSVEHAHEFLSGMSNKKILQWDTRAAGAQLGGQPGPGESESVPVQDYDHHLAAVNTITFVDEYRRFMTTSDDKSVRVWDYDIPVPVSFTSEAWMYPLTRAAAHPSGKYVAYQSSDNQVVVYAARNKYRQNWKKSYKGHNNAGTAIGIDISADGQFVASGDTSGYVCFWDWKTCKMYEKLRADASGGSINHVLWHPQETSRVLTAGAQGDIKLWD